MYPVTVINELVHSCVMRGACCIFYSTVASLECSLSEANKACVELKQSAEDERTRASDCEAQVTRLSAELESLRESLNRKVILS